MHLLDDNNNYELTSLQTITNNINAFNKCYRKLISNEDKSWSSLINCGGARGVMVIVAGIGHGDTSSSPGLITFHIALIPLGKV